MSFVTNILKLRSLIIAIPVSAILIVACGKSEVPNLIEAPTVISPTPIVAPAMEELTNESVQSNSNGQVDNAFNTKEIERNYRGIDDETIKIAVVKSGNVFQDVEIGVKARIFRLNENGGINSRKLEIVKIIDDSGSEETLKSAVEDIVDQDIFALILLSTATSPAVTDVLAENNLPFFGDGSGWVRDPNSTSEFFNFVYSTLHYFRMHGFFLIAGFFGALLYQKRGAKKMMANRVKRILLPLLVMIAPISIMNAYFRNFSFERNEGHSILESFSRSFSIFAFPDIWELFPWTTAHLFFSIISIIDIKLSSTFIPLKIDASCGK